MYESTIASYKRPEYSGRKVCQGLCNELKQGRPIGNPYEQGYVFCKRCDEWMFKSIMKPHKTKGIVCPCCNFRPRTKTTKYGKNKKEVVYIE